MSARPWLPALRAIRSRRSVILCYHGLGERTPHDPHFLMTEPPRFRAQVEALLAAGFRFDTVAGVAEQVGDHGPPPGLAALSFDDGMEDNHSLLLPILRELGVPATVYVTTGLIGEPNPWLPGARMMSAEQLRELVAEGWELGAHTVSHPNLAELPYDECLREMTESRDRIEQLTGAKVRTFAYPFCLYGPAAVAAAHDAGFLASVTCLGNGGWTPQELRRSMITGKDRWPSFVLKVGEAYEPLFHSPPGRAVRGSTRAIRSRIRSVRERG